MRDYAILTDSGCDLPQEMVESLGIGVAPMGFTIKEHAYRHYHDYRELSKEKFYEMIRGGEISKTNGANVNDIMETMKEFLDKGKDILYLSFSSGMSGSCSNAFLAAREMSEDYPDATIKVVDTLCGSIGLGLITYLAMQKKKAGETLHQVAEWVEQNRLNVNHFFVVDDLQYIQRSGRISHLTAIVGTVLGIRPLFTLCKEGKVNADGKVRGKKAAVRHMLMRAKEKCVDIKTFFICHGDVDDEAEALKAKILEEYPNAEVVINCVGPLLGTNTGPGALALCFYGEERS